MATASTHMEFLAGVRDRIAGMKAELADLEAVERYHIKEIERLGSRAPAPSVNGGPEVTKPTQRFKGMAKHEAGAAVLREFGRPTRIPAIADHLRNAGYSLDLKRNILVNALFTAMSRREDVFEKIGPGLWALKEWEEARKKAL